MGSILSFSEFTFIHAVEEWMVESVLSGDSFDRVVDEHFLYEIDAVFGDFSAHGIKLASSPFGEGGFEVFEFGDISP